MREKSVRGGLIRAKGVNWWPYFCRKSKRNDFFNYGRFSSFWLSRSSFPTLLHGRILVATRNLNWSTRGRDFVIMFAIFTTNPSTGDALLLQLTSEMEPWIHISCISNAIQNWSPVFSGALAVFINCRKTVESRIRSFHYSTSSHNLASWKTIQS